MSDQLRVAVVAARDKTRLVRECRREIAPLADGLAERARKERIERLRTTVRTQYAAATTIQARVRWWAVQMALSRVSNAQAEWSLLHDSSHSGEEYWWNSITGQTSWSRPLDLLFI